jgi:hypothetical protein
MLQLINDLPTHVVGVHAYAEVSETEYLAVLDPLFETTVRKNRKINFVLILETEIHNFTSSAWCGNIRLGLKYFFRWNKIAIVTDQHCVSGYNDLFRWLIPGKFRNFRLADLPAAIKWVSLLK